MAWPDRGDVVWLSFDPATGHEQAGRRPALVLTRHGFNARTGLLLACPITSRTKGYQFEVPLPAGLPVSGAILTSQVRTIDWRARGIGELCSLPGGIVEQAVANIQTLLA